MGPLALECTELLLGNELPLTFISYHLPLQWRGRNTIMKHQRKKKQESGEWMAEVSSYWYTMVVIDLGLIGTAIKYAMLARISKYNYTTESKLLCFCWQVNKVLSGYPPSLNFYFIRFWTASFTFTSSSLTFLLCYLLSVSDSPFSLCIAKCCKKWKTYNYAPLGLTDHVSKGKKKKIRELRSFRPGH